MVLANVPEVYLGEAAMKIVPLEYVRNAATAIFAAIGTRVVLAALSIV